MSQFKYPRTYHLPWSKGATSDDKIATNINSVINTNIVITEKIDGGCTAFEYDFVYARTHSKPADHPSFAWCKALHAKIKHLIPKNIQIFGENSYALHSISYTDLPGYFLAFNVRNLDEGIWESWDMVEQWAGEIASPTVPVLFKGIVNSESELKDLTEEFSSQHGKFGEREGIVVRVASEFKDNDFDESIFKMVRKNHVKPNSEHWAHKELIKNKLR